MDMTGLARKFTVKTYVPLEVVLAAGLVYLTLPTLLGRSFKLLSRKKSIPGRSG
jgi:ABC-type arginine/histidine transport system permease subunit